MWPVVLEISWTWKQTKQKNETSTTAIHTIFTLRGNLILVKHYHLSS